MSQYHQGPHFPVSSSPIRPLDVLSNRPVARPFSFTVDPCFSLPAEASGKHDILALSESRRPLEIARSSPADWRGGEAPGLDASKVQHRREPQSFTTGSSSPYVPSLHLPNIPAGWQPPAASLNLVAYKPFPDNLAGNGTSFFYRSPTPSARQRTNQACEKCRERKTKCSGGRPTCVRCQARGLICEYASETRIRRPPSRPRKLNAPFEGAATSSATRRNIDHHAYTSRRSVDRSISKSKEQPAISKAPDRTQTDLRAGRSMSEHSNGSDESIGAGAYATRGSYLSLDGTQVGFSPGMFPPGFNAMSYRSQTADNNDISTKNKDLPVLRVSASMPQLKRDILHRDGGGEGLERSSSSIYSTTSLDASYGEYLSSSDESFHSRCLSSASSLGSDSHSSPEDDMLAEGISSTTIKIDSWPADIPRENGHEHDLDESEDPIYRGKENVQSSDVEGDTPRPSSHQFNASEWIHGGDYSQTSSDYQFPRQPTPESEPSRAIATNNPKDASEA